MIQNHPVRDFTLLCLVLVLIIGLGFVMDLTAAMSDSKAITEAFKIWGTFSHVAMVRTWGDSNWTKQIGFNSPGCQKEFTVMGEGFNTWDAAFATLPPGNGVAGPYTGQMMLHADVNTSNMTAPADLRFKLDGTYVGPMIQLVFTDDPLIEQANLPWDTTEVSDGFHALCGDLFYTDATSAKQLIARTHATLIQVKNLTPTPVKKKK